MCQPFSQLYNKVPVETVYYTAWTHTRTYNTQHWSQFYATVKLPKSQQTQPGSFSNKTVYSSLQGETSVHFCQNKRRHAPEHCAVGHRLQHLKPIPSWIIGWNVLARKKASLRKAWSNTKTKYREKYWLCHSTTQLISKAWNSSQ